MLSPRLMPRLSPAVVMVATDAAMVAMEDMGAATARGLLMLMPLLRLATAAAMVVMVATDAAMAAMVVTVVAMVAATATARGLLSPAMATAVDMAAMAADTATAAAVAMAATGVSYHRIRRSELS